MDLSAKIEVQNTHFIVMKPGRSNQEKKQILPMNTTLKTFGDGSAPTIRHLFNEPLKQGRAT